MTGKELFDAICTASDRPRAPMPYIHVGDEYSRLDEDGMPIPISGYENVTIDALVDLEQAARLLTEQTQADLMAARAELEAAFREGWFERGLLPDCGIPPLHSCQAAWQAWRKP